MKRVIVLVGPPGVGKSTLVKLAQKQGINAIDIEDIHNETKTSLSHLEGDLLKQKLAEIMDKKILDILDATPEGVTIIGAGGYGSHFPIDHIEKVLLLPPYDVYEKRWQDRDSQDEAKKLQNQKGEIIYQSFIDRIKSGEGQFHRVIKETGTPDETLKLIVG